MPEILTKNRADELAIITRALDLGEAMALEALTHDHIYYDKGDRDFALRADHAIEERLKTLLAGLTPQIPILGEEQAWHGSQGQTSLPSIFWVIDPIDGTVNYSRSSPLFGLTIALMDQGQPVAAGIGFPLLGDRYLASKGGGAWLNDRPLHPKAPPSMEQAIMALGDFSLQPHNRVKNQITHELLHHYGDRCLRIRMLGSAALQLAWLASGQIDVSITLSNQPWDVQAGVLIAQEAGALIYDRDGGAHGLHSTYTIGSPPALAPELINFFSQWVS